ncbi:MAG: hypothetical protein ACKO66_11740 [Flavobacteriales bacterium]
MFRPSAHTLLHRETPVLVQWLIAFALALFLGCHAFGQYKDNPLTRYRWKSFSMGASTMDYLSWRAAYTGAKRGEMLVTEYQFALSQEWIQPADDSCTDRHNRLIEANILWGDGWGGKHWFATATAGFGLGVRSYCDAGTYENRYVTATMPGFVVHSQAGVWMSEHWALGIDLSGNLNFRSPYGAAGLSITYRQKQRIVKTE